MAILRATLSASEPKLRIAGAQSAPRLPRKPAIDPATIKDIRTSGARRRRACLGFNGRLSSPELADAGR